MLFRQISHVAFGNCGKGKWGVFRHSVSLDNGEPVLFVQALHEKTRTGCTTGGDGLEGGKVVGAAALQVLVEHHPDGGYTAGEGHLFVGDHPAEELHIEDLTAGKDMFASESDSEERNPPGIGMEHGNHVENAILFRTAQGYTNGIAV